MTMMIPHIVRKDGTISLMLEGKMRPIDTAHKNYQAIQDAVKAQNWAVVPGLVNITKNVEKAIADSTVQGLVTIVDGEVLYNGTVIHNTLTGRIVNMAKDGFDIGYMVKFLENLMQNPSYRAVQELYDFLAAGAIPITENGTFLGYKKIKSDWFDIYSGTMDNSIGKVVSMPRNMVNEDSSVTCSKGLHVCSYSYLTHYGSCSGNRVVIVEINPRDVVSIPKDYNNTKMRVCQYTVVSEVEDYESNDPLAESEVFTLAPGSATAKTKSPQTNPVTVRNTTKALGKRVTAALRYGEVSAQDVVDSAVTAGLDDDFSEGLANICDNDTKRAGKKIARYLENGEMSLDLFEQALFNPGPVTPGQPGTPSLGEALASVPGPVPADDFKEVGKRVTAALDAGEIDFDRLEGAMFEAGLKMRFSEWLAGLDHADAKSIGKKVTRYLGYAEMNPVVFVEKLFPTVKTSPGAYGSTSSVKANTKCARCGAHNVDPAGQCRQCHFWN